MTSNEEIRKFIVKWNNRYPIDYFWRKKYGIPFGSSAHREMSFIDMKIDLEENLMMNELLHQYKEEESEEHSMTNGLGGIKMTETEVDEAFDSIDLTQYNISNNG